MIRIRYQMIEQGLKYLLTFIIMCIGAFMAMFAFDSPSWVTNILLLSCILLAAGVLIYFIWKKP